MPYTSDKQRRYFHYAEEHGKISPKVVNEFDKASKGMKLPEYAPSRFKKLKDKLRKS